VTPWNAWSAKSGSCFYQRFKCLIRTLYSSCGRTQFAAGPVSEKITIVLPLLTVVWPHKGSTFVQGRPDVWCTLGPLWKSGPGRGGASRSVIMILNRASGCMPPWLTWGNPRTATILQYWLNKTKQHTHRWWFKRGSLVMKPWYGNDYQVWIK